ncbi:ubiquitin carboxyl-terminal hydrolase 14 [Strigomonas culicis]|nr:ubiquitin carboxyl-terminal hydrolase 14 [Strigomonas culicis]|eukprot:EPY25823.1 ubiquitin carboxyl-terminal hydrolase 14 [Strigomonas culicis]
MNSAIEMVRTVPEVKEAILADTPAVKNNRFLRALGELLLSLDSTREAVTPFPFWSQLITVNPTFGERSEEGHMMQHDAQEALSTMLQQLAGALPSKYARLFQGTVQQTLKCGDIPDDAGNVSSAPFAMLQCNIGGEVQTLEAGLAQSFNETFDARSDVLGREAKFTKTSRLSALPEYLFVHMVRFSWKNDIQKKAKILKPITFPITLDVAHLCTEELNKEMKPMRQTIGERRDKEVERRKRGRAEQVEPEEAVSEVVPLELHNESGYYELCGVISHKGRSSDGGHYVYWGKKGNHWLIYDDQHVAEVSEEDILRLRGVGEAHIAYVLLYRSREPTTKKPVVPF